MHFYQNIYRCSTVFADGWVGWKMTRGGRSYMISTHRHSEMLLSYPEPKKSHGLSPSRSPFSLLWFSSSSSHSSPFLFLPNRAVSPLYDTSAPHQHLHKLQWTSDTTWPSRHGSKFFHLILTITLQGGQLLKVNPGASWVFQLLVFTSLHI